MMNNRVTTVAALAMLTVALGCSAEPVVVAPADPAKFKLHLEMPESISLESRGAIKITVENVDGVDATLVLPGDGSTVQWRTPIVGWSVLPVDSDLEHPRSPSPPKELSRCGNINSLNHEEIFTLSPGEKRDLSVWVGYPHGLAVGSYRVVFYYINRPGMKWSGISLGDHEAGAMAEVRGSTPIALVSNEVNLVVAE